MLEPAGPAATDAADLWWLMLGLGTVVFVLVLVLLVVGAFRTGRGPEETPGLAAPPGAEEAGREGTAASAARGPGPGISSTRSSDSFNRWWLLGGGVALPAVGILVVLTATIGLMASQPEEEPEPLTIQVVGHQWWWEIRYPQHGIVTANQIHIPAGQQVSLELRGADVIHSFWVPELAGKLDLLPDSTNTLVIEADEPGRYGGSCAEFCGLQHALMDITVVAEEPEAFARWVEAQSAPHPAPATDEEARGLEVLEAANCGSCHTVRGTTAAGPTAPDLTHLATRESLGAGALPLTPEDLADWILDPHDAKEGIDMEPAALDQADVAALAAYLLASDPAGSGGPAEGGR